MITAGNYNYALTSTLDYLAPLMWEVREDKPEERDEKLFQNKWAV